MGKMVGNYIQAARESFGLDLAEVAFKLGLEEEDLERIEAGTRRVSKHLIKPLCDAMGLAPENLIEEMLRERRQHYLEIVGSEALRGKQEE